MRMMRRPKKINDNTMAAMVNWVEVLFSSVLVETVETRAGNMSI